MISLGCTIIVFLFLLHDDNASIVLSSSNPDFAEKTSSSLTVHQSMQSRPKESTTPLVVRQSARLAATPLAPAATPTAPVLRTVETPLSPPRAMPRVSPAVGFSWGFLWCCPLNPCLHAFMVFFARLESKSCLQLHLHGSIAWWCQWVAGPNGYRKHRCGWWVEIWIEEIIKRYLIIVLQLCKPKLCPLDSYK